MRYFFQFCLPIKHVHLAPRKIGEEYSHLTEYLAKPNIGGWYSHLTEWVCVCGGVGGGRDRM